MWCFCFFRVPRLRACISSFFCVHTEFIRSQDCSIQAAAVGSSSLYPRPLPSATLSPHLRTAGRRVRVALMCTNSWGGHPVQRTQARPHAHISSLTMRISLAEGWSPGPCLRRPVLRNAVRALTRICIISKLLEMSFLPSKPLMNRTRGRLSFTTHRTQLPSREDQSVANAADRSPWLPPVLRVPVLQEATRRRVLSRGTCARLASPPHF